MTHTPHHFLAGPAVDALAESIGLRVEEPSYFVTDARRKQLAEVKAENAGVVLDHSSSKSVHAEQGKGTVGAVVLDMNGQLAGQQHNSSCIFCRCRRGPLQPHVASNISQPIPCIDVKPVS
jgi:isoaspartyl peptidase/L-asparaginase-like protein (Ntn-hydrolase superfamily)